MDKKIIVNLYGKNIGVVIKDAPRFLKTSHYSYGQIYITGPIDSTPMEITNYLKKRYKENLIAKFDSDLLYSYDYCYILGEKKRLIRPNMYLEINKGDIVIKDDEELKEKLMKLAKDIITSRVRKYEKIMNTYEHEIKITNMSAARGKNYILKRLLTFHWELVHFSLDLIDAIVVHELAHDFQANHSSLFYDVVYKYYPRYNEMVKKLTYGEKK